MDWINPTGAKRVHSLIDNVYKRKNLEMAWGTVKGQSGSWGVDGQSLDGFTAQLDPQLDRLQIEFKEDAYRPSTGAAGTDPVQSERRLGNSGIRLDFLDSARYS